MYGGSGIGILVMGNIEGKYGGWKDRGVVRTLF